MLTTPARLLRRGDRIRLPNRVGWRRLGRCTVIDVNFQSTVAVVDIAVQSDHGTLATLPLSTTQSVEIAR